MSDSLQPQGLQHTRLPCSSLSSGVCSNSCPLSQQCHPTISSCHPLLLLPSVFPSIRVFSTSRLFISDGQSIGASASVLPMNIWVDFLEDWLASSCSHILSCGINMDCQLIFNVSLLEYVQTFPDFWINCYRRSTWCFWVAMMDMKGGGRCPHPQHPRVTHTPNFVSLPDHFPASHENKIKHPFSQTASVCNQETEWCGG